MDRFRSSRAGFAFLLIAAAMLLRVALPTGWMPMADSDGDLRIMLCSGEGPVELVAPELHERLTAGQHDDTHGQDHGEGDAPHDPCPFGTALAKALDLPDAIATQSMRPAAGSGEAIATSDAPPFAARGRIPPARGPPAFA